MKLQNYEIKRKKIEEAFIKMKKEQPERFNNRLKLSWSNWGFGIESLEETVKRLSNAGLKYIELHGNHYTEDLGYRAKETKALLEKYGMATAGVCGMFGDENDLSSNVPRHRQAAIDYIKREVAFTAEMGGEYILVLPAACGRPNAYDDTEWERSVETMRYCGDIFTKHNVKAAVEPIRSAETTFVHTVSEAKEYIAAVNHPGVQHINGDVYHMLTEETHIGEAILEAGEKLVNLHMADSNRRALGNASMDIDCIIMSLYLIDYNNRNCFVTPEPLGPGGAPYAAMYGKPKPSDLEELVNSSVKYFREREEELLSL